MFNIIYCLIILIVSVLSLTVTFTKYAPAFWGTETMKQTEYYKRLDKFDREDYEFLFEYAYNKGIIPFSTPFGIEDAIMLNDDVDLITGQVEGNDRLKVGNIELRVAETKGHTPGGISYVGQGFAFVGDALFAGSLGGTRKKEDFDVQKSAVERNIFSLIESSVVFPGHGPATTVGEERKYNPFYFFS